VEWKSLRQQVNKNSFFFADSFIFPSICQSFSASPRDKENLLDMIDEWNSCICISDLPRKWKKERPLRNNANSNLLILLFNVEYLNIYTTDVDILLTTYNPHICILTGVESAAKRLPTFPGYTGIGQVGTNAFGGVAILYQNSLKCKIVDKELNFLLMEVETLSDSVLIGAIYVPPGSLPPFHIFSKCKNKPFYIIGDFNAKHTTWGCDKNNTSGIHIFEWLEATGNELIIPNSATSKRSNSIIDFGIAHDAVGWNTEVLEEGTSDHWPILCQSQLTIEDTLLFRETNWPLFTFFLSIIFPYWNSLVYNFDTETFFTLFSSFLNALHDRCSSYKTIDKFRPPWPPYLVLLARTVNKYRRAYQRSRTDFKLARFKAWKEIFEDERSAFLQKGREIKNSSISEGNNIWKISKPVFRPFAPPFRG
jgi:hypothetical protein